MSRQDFVQELQSKETLNTWVEYFYKNYGSVAIKFRFLKVFSINMYRGNEEEINAVLHQAQLFLGRDERHALKKFMNGDTDAGLKMGINRRTGKAFKHYIKPMQLPPRILGVEDDPHGQVLYNICSLFVDTNDLPIVCLLQFIHPLDHVKEYRFYRIRLQIAEMAVKEEAMRQLKLLVNRDVVDFEVYDLVQLGDIRPSEKDFKWADEQLDKMLTAPEPASPFPSAASGQGGASPKKGGPRGNVEADERAAQSGGVLGPVSPEHSVQLPKEPKPSTEKKDQAKGNVHP